MTSPAIAPPSAMARFVADRCTVGTTESVLVSDLFAAWQSWAAEHDVWPGVMHQFARQLRVAVPGVAVYRPRIPGSPVNDRAPRRYRGVNLR